MTENPIIGTGERRRPKRTTSTTEPISFSTISDTTAKRRGFRVFKSVEFVRDFPNPNRAEGEEPTPIGKNGF